MLTQSSFMIIYDMTTRSNVRIGTKSVFVDNINLAVYSMNHERMQFLHCILYLFVLFLGIIRCPTRHFALFSSDLPREFPAATTSQVFSHVCTICLCIYVNFISVFYVVLFVPRTSFVKFRDHFWSSNHTF